ncbi:hypothetical protein HBO32_31705, partial [Pseudomonas nitroreducens]|uniref:hypothetical protein n=1 Tax=Pseudomonas nitroreducens TaxID=46680 RepID=UPI001818050B
MIDHLDKQTQPMDLEPKRGRGRPATGQALSNADRQRAYRERQKAQRNEKGAGPEWDDVRKLTRYIDDLGEQLAEAINRAQAAEAKVRKLETELNEAHLTMANHTIRTTKQELTERKSKRHRDQPAVELPESTYEDDQEAWAVFGKKTIRAKKWTRLTPDGKEYASEKEAMTTGLAETDSLGPNSVYT